MTDYHVPAVMRELEQYFDAIVLTAEWRESPSRMQPSEFLHLVIEAVDHMNQVACRVCSVDTWELGEYYMVTDEIWKRYGIGRSMICIGCLEHRLGRELTSGDFTAWPINTEPDRDRSPRLRDRLGRAAA